jgi:hypothetical protein
VRIRDLSRDPVLPTEPVRNLAKWGDVIDQATRSPRQRVRRFLGQKRKRTKMTGRSCPLRTVTAFLGRKLRRRR